MYLCVSHKSTHIYHRSLSIHCGLNNLTYLTYYAGFKRTVVVIPLNGCFFANANPITRLYLSLSSADKRKYLTFGRFIFIYVRRIFTVVKFQSSVFTIQKYLQRIAHRVTSQYRERERECEKKDTKKSYSYRCHYLL